MNTPLVLLLAASAVAAPPPKPGPRIDLVAAPPLVPFPLVRPPFWGGYWGGASGFYLNGLGPQPQVVVLPPPAAVAPLRTAEDDARATAQASATLTVELPAAADVWLGDDPQPASAATTRTLTLTSPPLGIGQAYTFRVRAEWTEGNTKYRTEQTSSVRAGERGKLTVYAGTPIK